MPDFGAWLPDQPDFGHDGLVVARNTFAGTLGYEPFRSLSSVTAALSDPWRGGGAFDDLAGGSALVAGTDGGLEAYISGAWVSKKAGVYSGQWQFAQFGDHIIGTNGSAPVKYDMAGAAGADLGGSPPDARMVAIVRDFVFLAGDPADRNTVSWSAVNNMEGWTVGTNQSDQQTIPDGGEITGLAGGEYGLVFQKSAINIFEYVGTPLIFTRRKISETIGSVAPGGLAQAGKMVFFYSNRGFFLFNDGELTPIGREKVDRAFASTYTILEIESDLRVAIEPNLNLVMWSMPGRLWIYNWSSDRWSEVTESQIIGVTTGRTGYVTLDDLGAIYPGGNDTAPMGTDDPAFSGGDPMLMIACQDGTLKAFGGSDLLPCTLRTAKMEPVQGLDFHLRNVRPVGDVGTGVVVNIDTASRLSDTQQRATTTDLRSNGDMPLLARGRFIQAEIVTAADTSWTYLQGIDFEGTAGGRL